MDEIRETGQPQTLDLRAELQDFQRGWPDLAARVIFILPADQQHAVTGQSHPDGKSVLIHLRSLLAGQIEDPPTRPKILGRALHFYGRVSQFIQRQGCHMALPGRSLLILPHPETDGRGWAERELERYGLFSGGFSWNGMGYSSPLGLHQRDTWRSWQYHRLIAQCLSHHEGYKYQTGKISRHRRPKQALKQHYWQSVRDIYTAQRLAYSPHSHADMHSLATRLSHLAALMTVHRADADLFTCRSIEVITGDAPEKEMLRTMLAVAHSPANHWRTAKHLARRTALSAMETASLRSVLRAAKPYMGSPNMVIDYFGRIGTETDSPIVHDLARRYLEAVEALVPRHQYERRILQRSLQRVQAHQPRRSDEPKAESWPTYLKRRLLRKDCPGKEKPPGGWFDDWMGL